MASPLLRRRHAARAGGARACRLAWIAGLLIALVAGGTGLAGSGDHAPRAGQAGTPLASPAASPAATPPASTAPGAHATSPSTQIIVGEITIEIYDDAMEPGHFESAVGRDVTITVANRGTRPHNLTIDAFDVDIDLAPGETRTVEITGPALGNYRYYSDLPGDDGLEGVMTVFI